MKRKFKRIASLVLAAVMVFAMAVPAMATTPETDAPGTTYSITITNATKGHTYGAYQIFKGTMASTTDIALGDIEWGSNVAMTVAGIEAIEAVLGELYDEDSKDPTSPECAQAVAKALASTGNFDDKAKKFADAINGCLSGSAIATSTPDVTGTIYTISGLPSGYYLVKDEDPVDGELDVYTRFMLEVAHNETVKVKSDVPKVDKMVEEINDSTGKSEGWQDVADYDKNDKIQYQLTGTLPSNYADYEKYSYVFTDTLTKGLTFNNDVEVYVVSKDIGIPAPGEPMDVTGITKVTSHFGISTSKNVDGETTVMISANDDKGLKSITAPEITAGSVIVVRYTATLNENAVIGGTGNPNKVTLEYSNNPNAGGEGETGTTPEEKVTVFTFELDVDKVDRKDRQKLAGAAFNLLKWVAEGADGEAVTDPKTKEPYPAPAGDAVTPGKWVSFEEIDHSTDGGSDFDFKEMDAGYYKLVETKTPAGYNTIDPVDITVAATYGGDDGETLTKLTVTPATFTANASNAGIVEGQIENNEGATLPETGGIGTTIFYVVGSVLVLGAVILLVTKRRMKG